MILSPLQKKQLITLYPDLAGLIEQQEINNMLKALFSSVSLMKGEPVTIRRVK